jgi:putative heme-binding domain-containing protein
MLSHDTESFVRRHVASFAGSGHDSPERRVDALQDIALHENRDEWIGRSIASVDAELLADLTQRIAAADNVDSSLLSHLIERLSISSPVEAAASVASVLQRRDVQSPINDLEVQVLEAWTAGNRRARRSVADSLNLSPEPTREAIHAALDAAVITSEDTSVDAALRARAVALAIAAGRMPKDLRSLFAEQSPPEVRVAAIQPLLRHDSQWARKCLEEQLTGMSIRLRQASLNACGSDPDDASWLLDRISVGVIPKTIIDPEMAKRLRQHPNASVAAKAEALLRADPDRARVLKEYAVSSEILGDPLVGKRLFGEHCAACHQIDGVGTNVGPDISDTRTKSAESLLISVLDPNAAIDSSFVQFQVLTDDGRIIDGLLIDETADALTLQQKGGERVTVPRQEIEKVQSPGVSLMPEGFERTLDQEAMSHLLSYLKNWRYLNASIPGTLPK